MTTTDIPVGGTRQPLRDGHVESHAAIRDRMAALDERIAEVAQPTRLVGIFGLMVGPDELPTDGVIDIDFDGPGRSVPTDRRAAGRVDAARTRLSLVGLRRSDVRSSVAGHGRPRGAAGQRRSTG